MRFKPILYFRRSDNYKIVSKIVILTSLLARGLQFLKISFWRFESMISLEIRAALTLSNKVRGKITQRKLYRDNLQDNTKWVKPEHSCISTMTRSIQSLRWKTVILFHAIMHCCRINTSKRLRVFSPSSKLGWSRKLHHSFLISWQTLTWSWHNMCVWYQNIRIGTFMNSIMDTETPIMWQNILACDSIIRM